MKILFLGLSITSSWGNGHATNYRALVAALRARGHDVRFLERDVPWYAEQRDAPAAGELYASLDELRESQRDAAAGADLVVVGSYVPEGVAVAEWALDVAGGVVAFYDIDTPVTLAKLDAGDAEYLTAELVPRFDVYLSFTGGPTLDVLERVHGARSARAFHCLVDPDAYRPLDDAPPRWALGYLGTYSDDRQAAVDRLLVEPARALPTDRFVVAGPQYPPALEWPANVERIEHLAPPEHPAFYCAQRFTLNVTRRDMLRAGWSPSVRLFEAAACGVPVITDRWPGLERFFVPGREILVADEQADVVRALAQLGEDERRAIGDAARQRVLREHTAAHRAEELEQLVSELAAVGA
jgi:spore maturation protein CgeB